LGAHALAGLQSAMHQFARAIISNINHSVKGLPHEPQSPTPGLDPG